jgi:hypothetical protein
MDWILLFCSLALTALAETALHYLPWRMMLGRPLPPPWSYLLGVAAMLGPLALLMAWWLVRPPTGEPMGWALAGLLGNTATAGLTVVGAYALDAALVRARRARENAELLAQALSDAEAG